MSLTMPLIDYSPLAEKLAFINPDELTPKQALEYLYQLKQLAKSI
jgi:DNA mismatch repair protein MutS